MRITDLKAIPAGNDSVLLMGGWLKWALPHFQ